YRDARELAEALARTRQLPRKARRTATASSEYQPPPPVPSPNKPAHPRTLVAPWTSPRRNVNPAARRRTVAVFAVVLLVLAVMIAGAILTGGAQRVPVPNLRGLTRTKITGELARLHLASAFKSRHSRAKRGTAIAQQPAPGTRAAKRSRVTITISAGPPPVAVPGLVGFSSRDAESSLHQLGLRTRVEEVPAPGAAAGTVTAQTPKAGTKLLPGTRVSLAVAQTPRWRSLVTFSDGAGQLSLPFRIRGGRWRIVYHMAYSGTCTFIVICMGPTAHVTNLDSGTAVSKFDLSDGGEQVRTIDAGAGTYQVKVTPGDDSSHWSAEVQDFY